MDPHGGFVSVVTPSTVVAEGVYQFLNGLMYGSIWGMVCCLLMPCGRYACRSCVNVVLTELHAILLQVTPFYPPGSAGAAKGEFSQGCYASKDIIYLNRRSLLYNLEAATGVFRAAPPFSSWSSIPTNAVLFGSILGVQRLSSKTLEMLRGSDSGFWNDAFGFGVTYKYYQTFLGHSDKRFLMHNRVVGAGVVMTVLYASVWA